MEVGERDNALRGTGSRTRGPRLYHKKSRTGCIRCKARRVKCDETRPSCGGCSRHQVECVWPNAPGPSPPSASASASASVARTKTAAPVHHANGTVLSPPGTDTTSRTFTPRSYTSPASSTPSQSHPSPIRADNRSPSVHINQTSSSSATTYPETDAEAYSHDLALPESEARRMWELRLFHNYMTRMLQIPGSEPQPPQMMLLWQYQIPSMAMSGKRSAVTLLYGLFAHSALNILLTRPDTSKAEQDELKTLQQTYLALMLREQRKDVVDMSPQNADFLCFSSLKILAHALALVQTLPVSPHWDPPTEWLQMGRGAGAVFKAAVDLVNPRDGDNILTFLRSRPSLTDPADTVEFNFDPIRWLLDAPRHSSQPEHRHATNSGSPGPHQQQQQQGENGWDTELADPETRGIYEKALAYICSVQKAIDDGEPHFAVVRRLGAFAVWMPSEYTGFLVERRPRALVILAHFFALWLDYEDVWLIGKAGERQIRGISKELPIEWSHKLDGLFARMGRREGG